MRIQFNCLKCSIKSFIGAKQFDRLISLQTSSVSISFWSATLYSQFTRSFATRINAKAKENESPNKIQKISERHLNYVYISTSKQRWIEFESGVEFDVGLFDSFANKEYDQRVPVILGIPGCVGSHKDLVEYLYTFVALGYRVIVPNLPGTTHCKAIPRQMEHVFTMSSNEKAEFIKDVLETVNIPQVDMLVALSDSVHTALEVTSGPMFKSPSFKSLVLINPIGLDYTEAMKPLWLYKPLSNLIESNKYLAPVKRVFINTFKIFSEKRHWSADDVMLFSRHIGALSFEDAKLNVQRFKNTPLPLRVFYGDVGNCIDVPSTEEMLNKMGTPEKCDVICDKNGKLTSKKTIVNNQQCFFMPKGQVTEDQMTFIRTELIKFLKTLRPDILEL